MSACSASVQILDSDGMPHGDQTSTEVDNSLCCADRILGAANGGSDVDDNFNACTLEVDNSWTIGTEEIAGECTQKTTAVWPASILPVQLNSVVSEGVSTPSDSCCVQGEAYNDDHLLLACTSTITWRFIEYVAAVQDDPDESLNHPEIPETCTRTNTVSRADGSIISATDSI